jgi:hypothetical protein
MKSVRLLAVVLLVMGIAAGANAQATRTWVSGVGDDANPCSRTAPCKTFAGAISKTATNGIINVLDPGGFGAVTITKSITIDGTPFMAGVLHSGVQGIIINVSGGTVILRGLDIEGAQTGTNSVSILSAQNVIIERCNIFGNNAASPNGNGINVNTTAVSLLVVRDTTISNNSQNGIRATTTSVINKLLLENVRIIQNGQNGVSLLNNVQATFDRSNLAQNGAAGVTLTSTSSSVDAYETVFDNNAVGISTVGTNQVKIALCQIVHNTTSISSAAGVQTHGNNAIVDNGTNTLPGSSVTPAATNGQQ